MKRFFTLSAERLSRSTTYLLFLSALFLTSKNALATHVYGADLFYTHVSGNTYSVEMYIYADCSGNAFSLLPGTPQVRVYNGNNLYTTLNLSIQNPTNGLEVTPVCPAQINNTKCKSLTNTYPGVKRFYYKGSVTLNTTSANWRFRFTGQMGNHTTGRTTAMTNINNSTGNSTMELEATLNNTVYNNSSPLYTTIPTPFYCINKMAQYNPGIVDVEGDSLVHSLVPGIQGSGTVSYKTGYSGTNPLAYATGTFSFSSTTGQLVFTPNIIQQSLVVTKAEEYRNGTLIGSSMREMTFIVWNCSNNPPGGIISENSGGNLDSTKTKITVCKSNGMLTFKIKPTDLDTHKISISSTGLPSGASMSVTNNNSTAPIANFTWDLDSIGVGTYTFYLTFQDDGCPISSKQSIAYTVVILPDPVTNVNILSHATCTKKGIYTTSINGSTTWSMTVLQNNTVIRTFNNISGTKTDSLDPGTYTVRAFNADSCFADTTITIDSAALLNLSASAGNPLCYGASTGSISVTAIGGKPSFTYSINSGTFGSSNTFSNLPAGTHTIIIKDQNDCYTDTNITLNNPVQLLIDSGIVTDVLCYNNQNGTIKITAKGGVTPYTYALGTGSFSSNNTYSNLTAGTYILQAKDGNGCLADTTLQITQPAPFKIDTLIKTNLLCFNDHQGQIQVTAMGGTLPYTYALGTGSFSSTNIYSNLAANTYTIYAKDNNGCLADTNVLLTQPTQIAQQISVVNPACNGDSTGSVSISASGGTPAFTYSINNGSFSISSTYNNLPKGIYTFSVKDVNGCQIDTSLTLTEPNAIQIDSLNVTTPLCYSNQNGQITIYGSGGTPAYTYAIGTNSFGSSNSFGNLGAGIYTLRIKDNKGCEADTTYSLIEPQPVTLIPSVNNPDCGTLGNGIVILTGGGGTPNYTYAVGAGAYGNNATFSSLSAGTYTFHLKDFNNCQLDTTLTLTDSLLVTANLILTDAQCKDSNSGHIVVQANGGASPYSFSINNSSYQNGASFNNLSKGTYTVKVKDALGCMYDTSVILTEPSKLIAQINITTPKCFGDSGSITIAGNGGTPLYLYAQNTGAFSSSTSYPNLLAGTYTFTVKDQNNCFTDTTVTISQPDALYFDSIAATKPLCYNDQNGIINISGAGGTPTLTYAIGAGSFGNNKNFGSLPAGTYTFHLKDANGCTADTSYTLDQPTLLSTSLQLDNSDCSTLSNGQIALFPSGGTPGYKYAIGSGTYNISHVFNPLASGTYTVHVRDANNCQVDTTVSINDSLAVSATLVTKDALCYDSSNGIIIINSKGGASPYTYSINNSNPAKNNIFNTLKAGTYNIHITDTLGCVYDTTATLDEPAPLVVKLRTQHPSCVNGNDGEITVEVSGGTKLYHSSMDNLVFNDSVKYNNLPADVYKFDITDSHKCLVDTYVIINDPSPLNIAVNIQDVLCNGDSNGVATINVTGGTPGYIYARDSGTYSSNQTFTGLKYGMHSIQIKDSKGCLGDTIINIGQPEPLIIKIDEIIDPTCVGYKDGSIKASGLGGITPYTFGLNNGLYSANNHFTTLPEGLYTVSIKDNNNCIADTTVELSGLPEIVIDSINTDDVSCYGYADGSLIINASGGIEPFGYQIEGAPIQTSNYFDSLTAGVYTFKVTDSAGCEKDGEFQIHSPEKISSLMRVVPNNCDKIDTSGYIEVISRGGTYPYYYLWSHDKSFRNNVLRNPLEGPYRVTINDANGCIDSTEGRMEYDICCRIFIPDAFTPNGDGINDVIKILVKGEFQLKVFSIYNRFGERVFTTTNINEGWDGVWKGRVQDISTFNYYAEGICGSDPVFYKGTITLIK